jgi:hypothetical protein
MRSKHYNDRRNFAQTQDRDYSITLDGYSPAQIDEFLIGWTITELRLRDGKYQHSDWMGTHRDGRRTAIKGLLNDVIVAIICDEILCAAWPSCEHNTPQLCARASASRSLPKWKRAS